MKENWQYEHGKSSDMQWYFMQVLLFWCCLSLPDVVKTLSQRSQLYDWAFWWTVFSCLFRNPDLLNTAPHWPHLCCLKAHLCAFRSSGFAYVSLQRLQLNHLYFVSSPLLTADASCSWQPCSAFLQMSALRFGAMSFVMADIFDLAPSRCGLW